jgi:hypothetical protein
MGTVSDLGYGYPQHASKRAPRAPPKQIKTRHVSSQVRTCHVASRKPVELQNRGVYLPGCSRTRTRSGRGSWADPDPASGPKIRSGPTGPGPPGAAPVSGHREPGPGRDRQVRVRDPLPTKARSKRTTSWWARRAGKKEPAFNAKAWPKAWRRVKFSP